MPDLAGAVLPPFETLYGRRPEVVRSAPGRINLIGEHTDYNQGFVLPIAVPRRTTVELACREDGRVFAATDAFPEAGVREYRLGRERRSGDWLDYVQGCTWALGARRPLPGFAVRLSSTLPPGAGLASSAALLVALLRALRSATDDPLDDRALALLAHRAEHDFVGARVGVMDQFAASLGDDRHALFLDTRELTVERIPLPAGLGLVVIDSGIAHRHATGGYNARRAECEAACATLGVRSLRDLAGEGLERCAVLPERLARRVRHVVGENARVLAARDALRAGDLPRLGRLLSASHASLRDEYEVSAPAVDTLVAIATAEPAVYGARLTGGGFGGAVLVAVEGGSEAATGARIVTSYRRTTGLPGRLLLPGDPPPELTGTPA